MKLGLVLEGGGVKGAYQAGALKALSEIGVDFDGYAGTSIGALNSAVMLHGGIDQLEEIWDTVSICTVFDINDDMIAKFRKKDFDLDMLFYAGKKLTSLREVIRSSYDMSSDFLKEHVSEEVIRKNRRDFGFVTYNMSDMKPVEVMKEDVEDGKLIDFIIASATFPIFPPKIIDGKKYIDGGVYDNMPINLLASHGYDKMLVIRTNTASKQPKRKLVRDDLQLAYIVPQTDLGLAMSFTEERVASLRNLGYHDCKKALMSGLDKFLFDNNDVDEVETSDSDSNNLEDKFVVADKKRIVENIKAFVADKMSFVSEKLAVSSEKKAENNEKKSTDNKSKGNKKIDNISTEEKPKIDD
ncbi:MAG: patatin-like phospholipase family protein [Clostridia bacterium]